MNKNLSRRIRLLIQLNEELKQETNKISQKEIIEEILNKVSTLKQFKKLTNTNPSQRGKNG